MKKHTEKPKQAEPEQIEEEPITSAKETAKKYHDLGLHSNSIGEIIDPEKK